MQHICKKTKNVYAQYIPGNTQWKRLTERDLEIDRIILKQISEKQRMNVWTEFNIYD
jgi:hypothetical protein